MGWFIFGLVVGAGAAWGCTYLWFRQDKVRAKIAAKYQEAKSKVTEKIDELKK